MVMSENTAQKLPQIPITTSPISRKAGTISENAETPTKNDASKRQARMNPLNIKRAVTVFNEYKSGVSLLKFCSQ